MYIVTDENNRPTILINGYKRGKKVLFFAYNRRVTVFEKYHQAKAAIRDSEQYAIEKGITQDWRVDKWKIVSLKPAANAK